ncbi:hypothetical protein [Nannocystis bainbridge]|uniref:DUF1570 domain-containing protein n=1 Tax=Nannocystis bainbridge TaxID=2995303 RepID=A0ABT5ED46_9BACT|nr:hypothetical protein [Nannocystis bainbridge]MDC0722762.1 hypothetical protein [Nannocystis bainbridge]
MHRREFALGLAAAGMWACGDRPASAPPRPAPRLSLEPEPDLPSPGPPPPPVAASELAAARIPRAALDARADALRQRHADRGFTVLVEPPFVILGDEPAADVQRRADRTIHWSVLRLRQDYFARDPARIIDVYLFADRLSYGRNTQEIFGEEPDTPYGYYSPRHAALIMNIGTGGGTLVHEIVHPFMASNFPACPAWFNEGLASLYEQCGEHAGRIVGYPNWRLPGLQAAIRARRLRSFAELCATDSDEFYGARSGLNYAQARYLCYYLQEQDRLRDYYHAFVAGADLDPGGYTTLQKILGHRDMPRFEREWRRFVLDLQWS